ncbi:hypothetical protein IEQ34_011819 [Dendrobium chrysotoxum]|uniref:Uncharacterized protein n=1 Tax=Dendrobium chrysotoxum TaxID=161865 RepID=A0AAV7GUS5_DENCH|nr:hypothetical protein IEQ34_011819 [Dendrobium chrysotoxum]
MGCGAYNCDIWSVNYLYIDWLMRWLLLCYLVCFARLYHAAVFFDRGLEFSSLLFSWKMILGFIFMRRCSIKGQVKMLHDLDLQILFLLRINFLINHGDSYTECNTCIKQHCSILSINLMWRKYECNMTLINGVEICKINYFYQLYGFMPLFSVSSYQIGVSMVKGCYVFVFDRVDTRREEVIIL